MGVQVIFRCDHEGCASTFACDSAAAHDCDNRALDTNVPVDLGPVVRFLSALLELLVYRGDRRAR